jgi:hypothetical protein
LRTSKNKATKADWGMHQAINTDSSDSYYLIDYNNKAMSPSNNLFRPFNESNKNTTAVPIVPFPNLTPSDAKPRSARHHGKLHHQPTNGPAFGSRAPPSAPISFPKSHIRRTPSELQMEQSLIQAEQSDHIMYARLVRGMTERGAALHHGAQADVSGAHELSRKSLMGVLECRQRPILEEGGHHQEDDEYHGMPSSAAGAANNGDIDPSADSGWSIGYSYEDNHRGSVKQGGLSGIDSQEQVTMHHGAKSFPQEHHEHCRELSADSSQCEAGDEEDDCVFSLEM